MLRYFIAAIGLFFALTAGARAEDACNEPPLTPAQWAALPDHDRIEAFQRLVQCAEEGIAIAETHVRNLSSARIAESADTWLGERNHLADLVQSYSAQLAAAKEEINALTNGRTALEAQIKTLNDALTKAESDRDAYLAALTSANAQIGSLVGERDKALADLARKQAELDAANKRLADLDQRVDNLTKALDQTNEKMTSLQAALDDADAKIAALNQTIETLNASLADTNSQMAALEESLKGANAKIDQLTAALADSNKKIDDLNGTIADLKTALADANQKIADLTNALCVAGEKVDALANRLAPYSAQFALGLKGVLAGRDDVFLDGNRVIVAAEVLFPTGSAELTKPGIDTVNKAAAFLKDFAPQVPADLKWWLQVNGHTDIRPIKTRKFPSNWELSTARALSVLNQFLKDPKVPADHLAAAGFGQYQPLAPGNDPEVLRHNRRIEMEITGDVTPPAAPASNCAPK